MRNRSLLAVAAILAALPVNLAWGQANLPNNPNAATVQGPDPTGMLGYPLATVPATGALPWPVTESNDALDTGNSTTTPLLANGTFTGAWKDLAEYRGLVLFHQASHDAASLLIDWSPDGVSALWTESLSVNSGAQFSLARVIRKQRYYRVRYTTTGVNLTSLTLQSWLTRLVLSPTVSQTINVDTRVSADDLPAVAELGWLPNPPSWIKRPVGTGGLAIGATLIANAAAGQTLGDFSKSQGSVWCDTVGNTSPIAVVPYLLAQDPNAPNNPPTVTRQRTTSRFFVVSTAAAGSTALWTPTASRRFRVMRWRYTITGSATTAGGADVVIRLFDGAVAVPGQQDTVTVPAAATTTQGQLASSPWIDLGNGYAASAVNNVLNVNLSVALTAGTVTVEVAGMEET